MPRAEVYTCQGCGETETVAPGSFPTWIAPVIVSVSIPSQNPGPELKEIRQGNELFCGLCREKLTKFLLEQMHLPLG